MGILAPAADERVLSVKFTKDTMSVSLRDGRTIAVPLAWYPRLLKATVAQRKNWRIAGAGYGIHWPDVDEDLSTEGLLRGAPAPRGRRKSVENLQTFSGNSQFLEGTFRPRTKTPISEPRPKKQIRGKKGRKRRH